MDFRWKNVGQFDESGHSAADYANLDPTLPESEFLADVDPELVRNTYVEYSGHWMRSFIRFTDAEFEAFEHAPGAMHSGAARLPEADASDISASLQYLDEWKKRLKERRLEDDYEVKLPNGLTVPYAEYLFTLNADAQRKGKAHANVSEGKERRMAMHAQWHRREAVHDEYGRAHGEGRRKNARASAMVYAGDGSVFINGKHFGQYFHHYVDRMNVMVPLLVTDMDRKLNAWCTVEGGGDSGQSGACREAIAWAVAHYQPTLYPYLHGYKLTTRDFRRRERKKSGKPGARKSVRWTRR